MFSLALVSLSVCLSVSNITQKVMDGFDEIFRKCQKCSEEQLINFGNYR